MGNKSSQQRGNPHQQSSKFPIGDMFVRPNTTNHPSSIHSVEQPKYTTRPMQTSDRPRMPFYELSQALRPNPTTLPSTALKCNMSAYEIHRRNMNIDPEMMSRYQAQIDQHALAQLEHQKRLRQIMIDREIATNNMFCNTEPQKQRTSLSSICDFAKRYANLNILDKKYFSPKPERPELTDQMLGVIKDASRRWPEEEVLTEVDGVNLTRKDFHTLVGLNWLNDEIINAYMSLIVARGKKQNQEPVYAFNTFFYPKLRDSGYASVKRWTRKVDIFSFSFLLVPIHLGNHWCLAVVDFTTRTISYYDSLGGRPNGCCDILLGYLKSESMDKKKQDFDDENWRTVDSYLERGIPKQENGSDCGVFACVFAEYLTRKAKLNFSQEHMNYFRQKMIIELMYKSLLSEGT